MSDKRMQETVAAQSAAVEALAAKNAETVDRVAGQIVESFHEDRRLYVAGTGSLGAIASLVTNFFQHRLSRERPPLPVMGLCQDVVLATSLEQDSMGRQFASRQLRAVARSGDCLFYLAEGNGDAQRETLETATEMGLTIILAMPGELSIPNVTPHFHLLLPSESRLLPAESSLFLGHWICEAVEQKIFGF